MTPTPKNSGTALVFGGSGGLGSAICHRLASDWDNVFFTYHNNADKAEALKIELSTITNCAYSAVDMRNTESIVNSITLAQELSPEIGTVVFASGARIEQPFVADIESEQWEEVFEVELKGFTRVVKAILPIFRQQRSGSLVSVVSFAPYHFPPGDALSAVPKAGIEILCRAIAREEGKNGIRANSVAPGIIDAGLGSEFMETLYSPEVWEKQRKRVPLKRFGKGEEIANTVAFFSSPESSYITGQTIIVDGGMSL
tara:strand:+ start:61663 stop:62430 length:768 start_codon:yes stop_codon:yes gene_type:complete